MHTHSQAALTRFPVEAFGIDGARLDVRPGWARHAAAPPLACEDVERRILIVSEDMRSAECLKEALHFLGYRATMTAYSARRALVVADDFSPQVAFVDLVLPDMSGFQLAYKLHGHANRHVRSVSLLAIAERDVFGTRELARATGFVGCLTKPVERAALNEALQSLWG